MIIDTPGWVTDRILLLGRKETCVYLINGTDEYVLLGGGMIHVGPDIIGQVNEFGIDARKIKWVVILHSHFDHCGIVPYIKHHWPWIRVAGSVRTKDMLAKPKVIQTIEALNQKSLTWFPPEKPIDAYGLQFSNLSIDQVLSDGQTLTCGDQTLEIIDTPGHSSCSISVYMPEQKAMFGSDAGGIPFEDTVLTSANSNFDLYLESLQKIFSYDIKAYMPAHYGARTGDDCSTFIEKSKASARETLEVLEATYARTQNVEECVREMVKWFGVKTGGPFLSQEIVNIFTGQMVSWLDRKKSASV